MVAVIESYQQFKEVTAADKVTIVDFWATWCGPCKVIGPVFEKLESVFPEIGFAKCDVDAQEEVAAEVGIKAMPTFVVFKNGEKIGTVVGADPNKLKGRCPPSFPTNEPDLFLPALQQALEHHKANSV